MDFDRTSSTGISAVPGMVCPADEALGTEVAGAAWKSNLIYGLQTALYNYRKTICGPREKKCPTALNLWFFQLCAVSEKRGQSRTRRCCLEYHLWDLVSSRFSLTFPTSFLKLKLSAVLPSVFFSPHWKVQNLLVFPLRQLLQPLSCLLPFFNALKRERCCSSFWSRCWVLESDKTAFSFLC